MASRTVTNLLPVSLAGVKSVREVGAGEHEHGSLSSDPACATHTSVASVSASVKCHLSHGVVLRDKWLVVSIALRTFSLLWLVLVPGGDLGRGTTWEM